MADRPRSLLGRPAITDQVRSTLAPPTPVLAVEVAVLLGMLSVPLALGVVLGAADVLGRALDRALSG